VKFAEMSGSAPIAVGGYESSRPRAHSLYSTAVTP
jgi:hypothetical protein